MFVLNSSEKPLPPKFSDMVKTQAQKESERLEKWLKMNNSWDKYVKQPNKKESVSLQASIFIRTVAVDHMATKDPGLVRNPQYIPSHG